MMKPKTACKFIALCFISGLLSATLMQAKFARDRAVLAARKAIAESDEVRASVGTVVLDDVKVFAFTQTISEDRMTWPTYYSMSVSGSRHGAIIRILVKKGRNDEVVGAPEIVSIEIRD